MLRQSTSRKLRGKILWMTRAVKTCFVLAFSICVVSQLKLILTKGTAKHTQDLTPEISTGMQKLMPDEPLILTRKGLLRVSTEVMATNDTDEVKERSEESVDKEEENDGRTDEWMERLDFQFSENADTANDTSEGVQRAENMGDGWRLTSVTGSKNFENLDASVLENDQYEKEDNMDMEVVEERTNVEEVGQDDALDQ